MSANSSFYFEINEKVLSTKFLLSITVLSTLTDILIILIVFKAKHRLLKTEFYILIQLNVYSFVYSISNLMTFLVQILTFGIVYQYECHIAFLIQSVSVFGTSVAMLYYSLFHLSFLARSKWLIALNTFVRNSRHFFVFSCSLAASYATAIIVIGIVVYEETLVTDLCVQPFINIKIIVCMLIMLFPIVVTIIDYLVAVVFVLAYRSANKFKHASMDEQKRFKRNFKLILKFLLFNLVNLFKTAPLYLLAICNFMGKLDFLSKMFYFLGVSYFMIIIQPLVLVLIQNILRKQLKELVGKFVFKFLKE